MHQLAQLFWLLSLIALVAGCTADSDDDALPADDETGNDDVSNDHMADDDDTENDVDDDTTGDDTVEDDVVDDDIADDDTTDDDTADDDFIDDDTITEVPVPIYDSEGRTLILHGANFMAIEAGGALLDYERMAQWGFNVVRILVTWSALEPMQGAYDENYLPNVVEPQIQYAREAGLNVILDMHQYHWSSCCKGMGMPEWTCADLGDPPLEWLWQSGQFWDHEEFLNSFVAAWDFVSTYFAGDDRIFAYDLFNEPIAGIRTIPWFMDDQLLRPLYERLIPTVRANHPEPYLIIEPPMITVAGFPFTMTPLPDERLIYGPHLYPGTIAEGGGYTFPKAWIVKHLNIRQAEALEQGEPLLIGETGLQSAETNAEQYARDAVDLMEERMAHWTWWAFGYDDDSMGLCDASGNPKDLFYRHLARPYPRVTAGVLRSYHFDTDVRLLTVVVDNAVGLAPAVEIFVNEDYYYPEGFVVNSTDTDGTWSYTYDELTGSLAVTCDPTVANHVITIEPDV